MNTWVVCVNKKGARIFECRDPSDGLTYLRTIPHTENLPSSVNRVLTREEDKDTYQYLILSASEPLLGSLRQALTESLRKKIIGEIPEDLCEVNESDLINYVRDFIERGAILRIA